MTPTTEQSQPTLRDRRGSRSLDEVASRIGVAARTLRRWENNEKRPDAENLIKLAAFYRVHPRNLFPELAGKER